MNEFISLLAGAAVAWPEAFRDDLYGCSTVRYAQVRQPGVLPMPRTCSCVIALTAMVVALSTARAAEPETLTLACQGTTTDAMQPDAKPQQITMGVVINFSVRTVAGFTYPGLEEFPIVIRDANEVHITFTGSNESGSSIVAGDINRVTGELWASSMMRDANTSNIVTSTTYSLKCRPA